MKRVINVGAAPRINFYLFIIYYYAMSALHGKYGIHKTKMSKGKGKTHKN